MRIALIHFQPLEWYPPVCNLLNSMAGEKNIRQLQVYSCRHYDSISYYQAGPGQLIQRFPGIRKTDGRLKRLLKYMYFNLGTLLRLLKQQPEQILYIETLSAWPALLYKKLFPRTRVLVHYHEYVSPAEIESGMALQRYLHRLENKMYPQFSWLSHTNAQRLGFFMEEHSSISAPVAHVMPNYPPAAWTAKAKVPARQHKPFRLVYVGAVSFSTLYFRELFEWILARKEQCSLDIYSLRIPAEVNEWIQAHPDAPIQLKGPLNYQKLPDVLPAYDVGLILYKGHIPNYIYNAPNKLFEYLACGLDVWYPQQMSSCHAYADENHLPKVLPLDFEKLETFDLNQALERSGKTQRQDKFSCEEACAALIKQLSSP